LSHKKAIKNRKWKVMLVKILNMRKRSQNKILMMMIMIFLMILMICLMWILKPWLKNLMYRIFLVRKEVNISIIMKNRKIRNRVNKKHLHHWTKITFLLLKLTIENHNRVHHINQNLNQSQNLNKKK